jgi:cardiolipin synthase
LEESAKNIPMFGNKRFIFIVAPLLIAVLCGCSTTSRDLVYDHTVRLAKRPIFSTSQAGWRVKTFWSEEVVSSWRRYVSFPLLSMRRVPVIQSGETPMPRARMAKWLEKRTGAPSKGDVQLLLNGAEFFPRFTESIRTATNRIDLKTYIFDNDDVALEIADQLKARSRNVDIRILYDAIGTRSSWNVDANSKPDNARKAKDIINYLSEGSALQTRRGSHMLLTSEHSKFYLFDDQIAYFGGMNIGREYRYDWRDAMFALTGPVIDALSCRFDAAWLQAKGDTWTFLKTPKLKLPEPLDETSDLYLTATTPFSHTLYKGQLRAIKNAKKCIYVENPYLWNQPILYQLCAARKRGVDVRVTIPRDVNHPIASGANKATVACLLKHGVRVFLYPGMTHVKAALYDNWVCFGSANYDDLSLHKNYELNIFTDNPSAVRQIRNDLLEQGQSLSKEIFTAEDCSLTDLINARLAQYL